MASSVKPLRKRRLNSPNDHIIVLVKELYEDARTNGLQTMRVYKKALQSLEKYPLRLETGADCRILYGFGEKICQIIDEKLNRTISTGEIEEKRLKNDKSIDLIPNDDSNRPITKRIVERKNTTSSTSSSVKNPTTISTLLGISTSPTTSTKICSKPIEILSPGSFRIVLCIDNAEASRSTQKILLENLKKAAIEFDVRKLNIGDFLWLVRPNDNDSKIEAILDYIVERKRLDDLSKSIIDGRYNEQKFRLKQCGISNLIYLVESLKNTNNPGILTPAALNQAIVNTQVAEEFFVKEVSNPSEMSNYLVTMTKHLIKNFKDKTFHILNDQETSNNYKRSFHDNDHYVMTFESFNSGTVKSKPPTVKEMFARSLMQIAGMSVDNVVALTEVYPTPSKLLEAYRQCSNDKERKLMLSSIKKITSNRKLGKVLSTAIEMLFNNLSYE